MRVTEISVKALFGTFNHYIPLMHADRVTLIHGPNGLGKTMMLKMIAALIDGRTQIFERVPFEEFIVRLDDGKTITVRHREGAPPDDGKRRSKLDVSVTDASGNHLQPPGEEILPDVPRHVLDAIDRHIPGPFGRSGSGWKNEHTGKFYSLDEILERFPNVVDHLPGKYRASTFASTFEGLDAFFVETTRLNAEKSTARRFANRHERLFQDEFDFTDDDDQTPQRYGLRVEQYSRDIVHRIKSALADYAKHSQESDRTFPERLVRFVRDRDSAHEPRKILDQMSELESKRQRLISLGFLDSESGLRDLTEDDVKRAPEALTIYVGDVQQKLAVFDDLSQRVGKLIDIVNERFRYKSLTLHRDQGFRLTTKSGEPIQLEDLSSGEQHELVVLYELLFRAPRNGLILVDEPEISLHVAWQSRFLSDLMDILQLTGSYGIVATHSPVIIGTRWDLTQELKGPDDQETERVA
jgi:ABC-type transport system involved in cytochrome c biogenesis ATPase subunit